MNIATDCNGRDIFIYAIKPVGEAGPVKIGNSIDPEHRVPTLALCSPVALELIGYFKASKKLERRIHRALWRDHSHREWFSASANVLEFCEIIASPRDGKLDRILDFVRRLEAEPEQPEAAE